MSVLIKGMDMPKNDSWVNVRIKEKDGKPIIAFITGEDLEGKYFETEEVPTPHGRLIDADRFLGWLEEFHPNDVAIMSGVKNARTVIEAEVPDNA